MRRRGLTVEPESAAVLAIFRITVCAVVLLSRDTHDAVRWATLPEEARIAPIGVFSWFDLPVTPLLARAAHALVVCGALAGLFGWYTRIGLTVAAVAATYLLGIPQLTGNVLHDHHLVWFLALLAASPCADAFSIEARDRGGPPPQPSIAYAVPLWFARALIAVIFFFPGLWKLRASGLEWITTDNLRNQMWWKWFENGGWRPAIRIDKHPMLCRALAGAAVAFELLFPVAVFVRPLRKWAAIVALIFHASIEALMRIPFSSLWLCYVVFIDVRVPDTERPADPRWRLPAIVGAALVMVNAGFGFAGISNGWPFACYPTFQWRVGTEIPGMFVEGERSDGTRVPLLAPPYSQAQWGAQWSALGLSAPFDLERLRAYVRATVRAKDIDAHVYEARWSVVPEDYGKPPVFLRAVTTIDF
ncbi:MAG: HTTM domain-containing protein [Polyangiales bacterium]